MTSIITSLKEKLFPLKQIYTFDNFLNNDECSQILDIINSYNFNKARQFSSGRNNKEIFINDIYLSNLLNKKFNRSFFSTIKFKKYTEPFEFYKYDSGDYINPHTDSPRLFSDNSESNFTAIIHLNDEYDGGATHFNDLDFSVKPVKGLLLLFNHSLKHEAQLVSDGVKYIYRSNWLVTR